MPSILLLRHSHAGSRAEWVGDDRLRPLSPQGVQEAGWLVGVLAAFDPARVISSPLVRCTQTVAPAAEHLGLAIEASALLTPDQGAAALVFLRHVEASDGPVVVCTHGEVIGHVLTSLHTEDGLGLEPTAAWEKSSIWVLERRAERFVAASYLPPPVV